MGELKAKTPYIAIEITLEPTASKDYGQANLSAST
jgi:hypothetical protein